MVALRRVLPRYACEPGSAGPSYASTSVRRTATSPWRSTAPSRRGATSRTGPERTSRKPGTVSGETVGQLGELRTYPVRGGPSPTAARGHLTLDREHRTHPAGQMRRDLCVLLVAEVGQVD